jgi:hypothetical protein
MIGACRPYNLGGTATGLPIKKVRSDNRTKFKNTQVKEFLDEEGIKHEFSSPHIP